MANWSLPLLTDTYTNFRSYLSDRLNDAAKMFDSATTTPTNQPVGSKRWNSTSNKFEKWSGSAWSDLASTYGISISGNAATATLASSVENLSSTDITAGLGYTPVNRAGETMTGPLVVPSLTSTSGIYAVDYISTAGTITANGAVRGERLTSDTTITASGAITAAGTIKANYAALHANGWGSDASAGVVYFGNGGSYLYKTSTLFAFIHAERDFSVYFTKGGTAAMVSDIPAEGVSKDQGYSSVGSLCIVEYSGGGTVTAGTTVSGALLKPSDCTGNVNGGVLSGTWRALGVVSGGSNVTLFQRIA